MRKTANVIFALIVASYVVLEAAGPAIPPPESVFGFKPGTDNKLATYDQTIAYLKKLETVSRSIRRVFTGGAAASADEGLASDCRSNARSRALWNRSFGSFSRQCRTRRDSA